MNCTSLWGRGFRSNFEGDAKRQSNPTGSLRQSLVNSCEILQRKKVWVTFVLQKSSLSKNNVVWNSCTCGRNKTVGQLPNSVQNRDPHLSCLLKILMSHRKRRSHSQWMCSGEDEKIFVGWTRKSLVEFNPSRYSVSKEGEQGLAENYAPSWFLSIFEALHGNSRVQISRPSGSQESEQCPQSSNLVLPPSFSSFLIGLNLVAMPISFGPLSLILPHVTDFLFPLSRGPPRRLEWKSAF